MLGAARRCFLQSVSPISWKLAGRGARGFSSIKERIARERESRLNKGESVLPLTTSEGRYG